MMTGQTRLLRDARLRCCGLDGGRRFQTDAFKNQPVRSMVRFLLEMLCGTSPRELYITICC